MSELPDWLRGVLLLGQDGVYYRPVGVDEQGRLTVVAVGEDGVGALHTLRVDDQGRIIMVPYGPVQVTGTVDANPTNTVRQIQGYTGTNYVPIAVDSQGQIIMVPRGANGNYLAVDPNGYLYTILKGEYEGQLRTVKLDSEGRISAFIIDSTDAWGQMLAVGNAELAARLGSPVTCDRRGSVVMIETFQNGLARWSKTLSGTGTKIEIVPVPSATGGYSMHFWIPSTGGSAYIATSTGFFPSGSFGLSALATFSDVNAVVTITIDVYTGSIFARASLQYNLDTGHVAILNSQNTWQDIATDVTLLTTLDRWYGFKIVADTDLMKYKRAIVGGREYNLSTIALYGISDTNVPHVEVRVRFDLANTLGAGEAYIDSVVLTAAEP